MDSDRHFELTGVRNELILSNLKELLSRRFNVRIRMLLIKGMNDSKDEIESVARFLLPYKDYKNFKGIDLLPYHKFGVNKYNQLDKSYPVEGDPSLNSDELASIESWIRKYGLQVNVVKH
jgi:pyruvate formate lyase activating enzyme